MSTSWLALEDVDGWFVQLGDEDGRILFRPTEQGRVPCVEYFGNMVQRFGGTHTLEICDAAAALVARCTARTFGEPSSSTRRWLCERIAHDLNNQAFIAMAEPETGA